MKKILTVLLWRRIGCGWRRSGALHLVGGGTQAWNRNLNRRESRVTGLDGDSARGGHLHARNPATQLEGDAARSFGDCRHVGMKLEKKRG